MASLSLGGCWDDWPVGWPGEEFWLWGLVPGCKPLFLDGGWSGLCPDWAAEEPGGWLKLWFAEIDSGRSELSMLQSGILEFEVGSKDTLSSFFGSAVVRGEINSGCSRLVFKLAVETVAVEPFLLELESKTNKITINPMTRTAIPMIIAFLENPFTVLLIA